MKKNEEYLYGTQITLKAKSKVKFKKSMGVIKSGADIFKVDCEAFKGEFYIHALCLIDGDKKPKYNFPSNKQRFCEDCTYHWGIKEFNDKYSLLKSPEFEDKCKKTISLGEIDPISGKQKEIYPDCREKNKALDCTDFNLKK